MLGPSWMPTAVMELFVFCNFYIMITIKIYTKDIEVHDIVFENK